MTKVGAILQRCAHNEIRLDDVCIRLLQDLRQGVRVWFVRDDNAAWESARRERGKIVWEVDLRQLGFEGVDAGWVVRAERILLQLVTDGDIPVSVCR